MRFFILCFLFLLFLAPSVPAYAACASPAGVAGDLIWNETAKRPAYCDGTNWRNFLKENSGSGPIFFLTGGHRHVCAMKPGGMVYCWGSNVAGATGQGTTSGTLTTPTPMGANTDWTDVSGGGFIDDYVLLNPIPYSCGIRSGQLYCWGHNYVGRTGLGVTSGTRTTPQLVGSFTDWSKVSVGGYAACGIRADGWLYCWGANSGGSTGLGTTSGNQTTPARVGNFTDWNMVSLQTGAIGTLACGIRAGGLLYCWGPNTSGRTGLGTTSGSQTTPAQVGSFTDWTMVSAGQDAACGIRAGRLYCWGGNSTGATGLGTTSGNQTTPAQVGSYTDWQVVKSSTSSSCAIRAGGLLYCWGYNANGMTGLGTTSGSQTTPAQVGSFTDWQLVGGTDYSACGLRANGALYCWGANDFGVTGLGTTTGQQTTPTLVDANWGTFGSGGGSGPCVAPDGVAGDIVYNSTHHVLQYCDGGGWHAVGPTLGSTGAGCANPAGVEGDIIFNTTHSKVQYCNGTGWHHVAPAF